MLPALLLALVAVVHNDLPFARQHETVEIPALQLGALGDLNSIHVFDGDHELVAQTLDIDGKRSLMFQTDVPANGARSFELRAGSPRKVRKEDVRVYGRFVRERFDDFAWENDRVAHRMYGPALETWQKEPLTSSAVDVWLKRTPRLVINDWYMVDDYHHDNGEGGDFYSAGASRGCGGVGLWRDGHLLVSKNFRNSRVLAAGPIRLVFELDYPGFETKRVTLDAGQNFNRFESRFVDGSGAYAAGIKKFANSGVRVERAAGSIRTWGPVVGGKGNFTCTLVFDPASIADITEDSVNHLVLARTPAVYYVGTAWDEVVGSVAAWDKYVDEWTQRINSPLRVEVK